jgi:hypothetical protein
VSKGEIDVYRRHRPDSTALYEVVRDNIETLFGAIDDGALAARIPKHARAELLAYLDCGLLRRGFARLKYRGCSETRLVAFSCRWRGFARRAWAGACAPATAPTCQEAGADVLYAPGLSTREEIAAVVRSVDRPVNVAFHRAATEMRERGSFDFAESAMTMKERGDRLTSA